MNLKIITAIIAATALLGCSTPSQTKAGLPQSIEELAALEEAKTEEVEVTEAEGTPIPVEPAKVYAVTCPDCTVQEKMALEAFQDKGITDRYALAALMGNIKQESRFIPDICEGGARVRYHQCHRGGFGLIQWTTVGRYDGLGRHSRSKECDPSTTSCQLSYLFTEREWKMAEPFLKRTGNSIEWYMQHCYKWLGWGIHGERTNYAYDYARKFSPHPGT